MAAQLTTTLTGTIQKYFEKAWMDQPQEDFRSPLANDKHLDTATIPTNNGQYCEMRKFAHLTPTTQAAVLLTSGDDSPITYAENSEPASGLTSSTTVIQVPFELIRGYVDLGNVQTATDPIDLMRKFKDEMILYVRRMSHQITNGHFVKGIGISGTAGFMSASIPPASTYLPSGFKCMYAGGLAGFASMTADSVFTMADFKRATSAFGNANVPAYKDGYFAAFIDSAIRDQLLEDPEFKDAVKRHQDLWQKTAVDGQIAVIHGCRFILQDDPYRCNLPGIGGALLYSGSALVTGRRNTGAVHVAHVLAPHAAAYVDFGGKGSIQRRTLSPTFKVQDISLTGTNTTVGFTVSFQASPIDRRRGINICGTTRFETSIDDLADAPAA
jgi:N4-gp56 family major capsid protein